MTAPSDPDSVSGTAGLRPREFIAFLSMVMALAAIGIDLMLPAFDEMRTAFGLADDSNELARVVTFYLLGMAVGPVFYGSLADRFGRRSVLWLGGVIYIAGAAVSALAPSLGLLLAARFLWGFGASAGRVVAFAIIRDTQRGEEMARTMSYVMAVFILVPVAGPSLGVVIVALGSWRWVFWSGALAAGLLLLWSTRLVETLPASARQPISFTTLRTTAVRMTSTPAALAPLLAMMAIRGVMASYLASSELLISEVFDRRHQFPVIFGGVAVVLGLASVLNGKLLGRMNMSDLLTRVVVVYLALAAACLAVAWGAAGRPSFWSFMPLLAVALSCQMFLTPNLNTMALEPMGDVAGTASALLAMTSTAGGAIIGAMVDTQLGQSITPLTVSMVGSALVILGLQFWGGRYATTPVPA
ncbi:MAG: multidrug effflux MFS transporter [Actinomycetia bacterium]|nr:multidrug effflux MFS transporter [Actinomycetes bacterium]